MNILCAPISNFVFLVVTTIFLVCNNANNLHNTDYSNNAFNISSKVLKIQVDSNTGLFDNSETMSVFSDDGHRFSGCSVAASYGGNMLLGSVVTKMMQCSLDSTTSALEPMTEALTEAWSEHQCLTETLHPSFKLLDGSLNSLPELIPWSKLNLLVWNLNFLHNWVFAFNCEIHLVTKYLGCVIYIYAILYYITNTMRYQLIHAISSNVMWYYLRPRDIN